MNKPNRYIEWVGLVWPRIWGVKRVYVANMDVPYAIAAPILRAELTSPIRFPGPKSQRSDTVITVQTRLRGLPYFDAQQVENQRLARLNLQRRSAPRQPTGTKGR